jgi:PKD repeat protein
MTVRPKGLAGASAGAAAVLILLSYSLVAAVDIGFAPLVQEASPGEFVTHFFAVANTGASLETVLLQFDPPVGWRVLSAPDSITLSPGEEAHLFLTIAVPPGAHAGEYELGASATSQSDPGDHALAQARTIVSPTNEIELAPPNGDAVCPGQSIEYEVTLTNLGNAQDSLLIEASSSRRFPVELSSSIVSLAPREPFSFHVRLFVPAGAETGRDVLTLRATSSLYAGVEDEVTVFTTVLPPSPEAIGGTLMEILPGRVRLSMDQNVLTGSFDSRLTFSVSGQVLDGFFSSFVSASYPFGPDRFSVTSYSILYRRQPTTAVFGNLSKRLTDLISVSCEGGSIAVDNERYALFLVGGGLEDEARFAGRVALGPEEANVGLSYFEARDDSTRKAIWSGSASAEPLEDWRIRAEAALGANSGVTSHALLFGTTIDTAGYFFSGEGFSVGTLFPGSERDVAGIRLSQRLRLTDLSLSLSLAHERDNVIGNPAIATTISDGLGFNLSMTPLDDGPNFTSTVEFGWDRAADLMGRNHVRLFLSVGASESDGVFPYAFSGNALDQIDHVLGTHVRTLTFAEGVGLSVETFYLFLKLEQEKRIDVANDHVLGGSTTVSLIFRPEGTLHEASVDLSNNVDTFHLTTSLFVRFAEHLDVTFDGSIAWDRADASAVSFGWGVAFSASVEIPVPFLLTKGRIEGRLFVDVNENETFDEADCPVAKGILAANQSEVSTNDEGLFRFPPFRPGIYAISARRLPGGTNGREPLEIDLHAGETAWVEVPLAPIIVISGAVFGDENRDGVRQEEEGGFAQVRVLLTDEEGAVRDTLTDSSGEFSFASIPSGTYTASLDRDSVPDRFVFTTEESVILRVDAEPLLPLRFGGYVAPRETIATFQPPTADFVYTPTRPGPNEFITFDATLSFDFDGEIATYAWDFDEDEITDAIEVIFEHAFGAPGTYNVRLTVTDDEGNSDTITRSIEVREPGEAIDGAQTYQPPIADFSYAPARPEAGDPVTFDAASSFDPDGDIASYTWDFDGDGVADSTGPEVIRSFRAPGTFAVRLTVTDDDGNADTVVYTIEVGGGVSSPVGPPPTFRPPTADFAYAPTEPTPTEVVTFDGTLSFDFDGEITAYAWDFDGDGTPDATEAISEHAFSALGTHNVSLTVTDDEGNTDTIVYSLEVRESGGPSNGESTFQPPIADFQYMPEDPDVGEPVMFNGMLSADPDGEVVTYAWDFNEDGQTDATEPISVYVFPAPGTYTVRLTTIDNDGNSDTTYNSIDVE